MVQINGKEVGSTGYGLMGKPYKNSAIIHHARWGLLLIRFAGFGWLKDKATLDQVVETMKVAFDNGYRFWSGAEFYGPPDWNSQLFIKEYLRATPTTPRTSSSASRAV